MMSRHIRIAPLLALPATIALAACVVAPPPGPGPGPAPVAIAAPPPPAPVVEAIPAPPSALYVWRPGHWRWNGVRWAWIRGHYVVRPA